MVGVSHNFVAESSVHISVRTAAGEPEVMFVGGRIVDMLKVHFGTVVVLKEKDTSEVHQ